MQKISFYIPDNFNEYEDFYKDEGKIKHNICYALSFLKTAFIKNVISKRYKEKLNYTLYFDNVIFFYPPQFISSQILKSLPFYNPSISCRDLNYKFECSSIFKYQPTEDKLTLYNSIIYMDLN